MRCDHILGECLSALAEIPSGSVDAVVADLPYGTTQAPWDSVIPTTPLWRELRRVAAAGAPVIMTASQPFTTTLIASNLPEFRHHWIWEKTMATGHLNAKRKPLLAHEDVVVFGGSAYYPQMAQGDPYRWDSQRSGGASYKRNSTDTARHNTGTRYPRTVQRFKNERGLHPNQKPVALMEYLIRTYTREGDIVLDPCEGSGTTGVAAIRSGRGYIGIEQDELSHLVAVCRSGAAGAE